MDKQTATSVLTDSEYIRSKYKLVYNGEFKILFKSP